MTSWECYENKWFYMKYITGARRQDPHMVPHVVVPPTNLFSFIYHDMGYHMGVLSTGTCEIYREDGGNGITFVHMLYTVFQYKRKSYDDMTGPQYISLASHVASVLNICVLARRKWVKQKQGYLVRICQQVFSPLF